MDGHCNIIVCLVAFQCWFTFAIIGRNDSEFNFTHNPLLNEFQFNEKQSMAWHENQTNYDKEIDSLTNRTRQAGLFRRPCSCLNLNCGCCIGFRMRRLNFSRNLCTNLTYDPDDFAIEMQVKMNERTLVKRMVSAKNPRPVCVPLPIGTGLDFCLKLFNIFTPGRNIHLCMDFQARIQKRPILILHFDCMRMGQDGVAFLKPEDNGGIIPSIDGTESPDTGGGGEPEQPWISELPGPGEIPDPNEPAIGIGDGPNETIFPAGDRPPIEIDDLDIDDGETPIEPPSNPDYGGESVIPTELPDLPSEYMPSIAPQIPEPDTEPPQIDYNIYDEVADLNDS